MELKKEAEEAKDREILCFFCLLYFPYFLKFYPTSSSWLK